MAQYLTNDVALYVSKTREGSYNGGVAGGTNYAKIRTQQPGFLLPQVEFVSDAGVPGNGHEFGTQWCPTYISHPAVTFTDDVNYGIAGRLLLRALGGAVTSAQIGSTTAYNHYCYMKEIADGRQLPSFSTVAELGGASYKMDGMVVDRFRLSQNRADRPQYSVDVIGSGKFATPHGLTSLPTTMDVAACLTGNSTVVKWTDGSGTTYFSGSSCTLRSWFIEVANNSKLNDRCPGDSTKTLTYNSTTTNPAYVGKLLRGNRVVTAQIVILLDSTIMPWERYVTGQTLNDVSFYAQSSQMAGGTNPYNLAMVIPNARIQSVEPSDNEGDAAITINLVGLLDVGHGSGAMYAEVINQESSSYV
jgi:hypothetical protein